MICIIRAFLHKISEGREIQSWIDLNMDYGCEFCHGWCPEEWWRCKVTSEGLCPEFRGIVEKMRKRAREGECDGQTRPKSLSFFSETHFMKDSLLERERSLILERQREHLDCKTKQSIIKNGHCWIEICIFIICLHY